MEKPFDEEEVEKQYQEFIKLCRVPEKYCTPLPGAVKSRANSILFDTVLSSVYSSVSVSKLEDGLYTFSLVVPGRTYEFVITPMRAYAIGKTLFYVNLQHIRKHAILSSDGNRGVNEIYIPKWAAEKVMKECANIVNAHPEVMEFWKSVLKEPKPTLH